MTYNGIPFHDEKYSNGPQLIPGRIMCAYYDLGGEGIAYHEKDSVNHGSGELNPLNGSYLNEFRVNESVSTSYVKFYDDIDNSVYNYIEPEEHMLYVGWTNPGNWINYTVEVTESGVYSISLLHTSRYGGKIALTVDGHPVVETIEIKTTYRDDDPVDWRQWHHWNYVEITKMELAKGLRILTLHTIENGNMNYAYLDFKLVSTI